jgi:FMN phosphatase YigB (HAD superfamily)
LTNFRAVLFDWRGTLALTLSGPQWIQEGFRRTGREASQAGQRVLDKITKVPSSSQLMAPDIDTDQARHPDAYFQVFRDAVIDQDLARELYAVESDPTYNPFAKDVGPVLKTIKNLGVRMAVLSDIHVDIRSASRAPGCCR